MTENKSFLNCKLLEVKFADDSDEYFTFQGYASTFDNIDRGDDMIKKGAFLDSIKEKERNAINIEGTAYKKLMPVLWQHNWSEPIGSFVVIKEDEKGLFVKGILPKSDDFVRGRVIPQMKAGSISDMSIGYVIIEQSRERDIRIIEKVNLIETSLVTIPMNPKANITGFKSMDKIVIAEKGTQWTGEDEMGAFIKDGQIKLNIYQDDKIVPMALFKAAYDVNCSDQLSGAKDYIVDAYEKMGMDSPFKETKSFRLDDIKSLSEREIESLLRSGVCFSQKMAKHIISLLSEDAQRDVDVKSQRDAVLKEALLKTLKTFN